jgi:hypothetical protein
MSTHLSPEMVALFDTYGEGPRSIGADLTRAIKAASTNDPLVVAAGPEMALYPGSAQGPSAQRFDICTKGGKELSGVANLGAALGSLVNLHALDVSDDLWRLDAERLLGVTRAAREVNSFELWRDTIAVEAFRGREKAIATMQDYGCALAIRYLEAILADQTLLTVEFLRKEVLEAPGPVLGGTIPFSSVMIATFFLERLDISHRIINWLRGKSINWRRALVLICAQEGPPLSGASIGASSIAQIIFAAADNKLSPDRLFIAPQGTTFAVDHLDLVRQTEETMRLLWANTKAMCDLGSTMFAGFPTRATAHVDISPDSFQAHTFTAIKDAEDRLAKTLQMRTVLEDRRQLLSGGAADFAPEQLRLSGNRPTEVTVPGLDGVLYPLNF